MLLFFFLLFPLLPLPLVLCFFFCYFLAADAALKEEHVIDGRTIDVKRAVPRDRAPQPRLVRVTASSRCLGFGGNCSVMSCTSSMGRR